MLPAGLESVAESIAETQPQKWTLIQTNESMSLAARHRVLRLNNLGSLFNFAFVTLGYTRLTKNLHGYICSEFEREHLRLVIEIPRDHFKTTTGTIARPMWRSLHSQAATKRTCACSATATSGYDG